MIIILIGWRWNLLLENRQVREVQQRIAENYVIYLRKLLVDSLVTTVLIFKIFGMLMGGCEKTFLSFLKNTVIKKAYEKMSVTT